MSFLTAEWRKLAMISYELDKSILKNFVPAGTELDLWNGRCFVSLIGFMFVNTRLMGFKIPFHSNFEEVNLRFYVKRKENGEWKRGVVFIKEIVPKFALTMVANIIYNENYETLKMNHVWEEKETSQVVKYSWKKNNKWNSLEIMANTVAKEIPTNSLNEFITEHYWGYAKVNSMTTNEYEVTHPRWKEYSIKESKLDIDFGNTYGENFAFLSHNTPNSVILAEGSGISVEHARKIKM